MLRAQTMMLMNYQIFKENVDGLLKEDLDWKVEHQVENLETE